MGQGHGRRRIRAPKLLTEAPDLGTLSVELPLEMQQRGTGGINRRGGGTTDARQRHQWRKPDPAKGSELLLPEALDLGTLSRQLVLEMKHQGIGRGADRRGRETNRARQRHGRRRPDVTKKCIEFLLPSRGEVLSSNPCRLGGLEPGRQAVGKWGRDRVGVVKRAAAAVLHRRRSRSSRWSRSRTSRQSRARRQSRKNSKIRQRRKAGVRNRLAAGAASPRRAGRGMGRRRGCTHHARARADVDESRSRRRC